MEINASAEDRLSLQDAAALCKTYRAILEAAYAQRLNEVGGDAVLLDAVVKTAKGKGYHGDVDQAVSILHVEGTFAASRLAVSVALQEAVCAPCEPAFPPVMAGVLIAGEVIKHEMFPDFTLDSCYWNTLLGQFMHRNRPTRRSPCVDCPVCQNEALRAQYARRWGEARAARSGALN